MKAWIAIAVVCIATSARAEGVKTIFPLSGTMPKQLRGTNAELTRVFAKSLGAEVANVPIEDAAELMECDLAQRTCLAGIAKSVGASTIVFGRIERRGDGLAVTLSTFDGDGEHETHYAIDGDTPDALATALQKQLDPDRDEPEPAKAKPKTAPASPAPEPTAETGKVTHGTWGLVIGGGVVFGVGAAVLLSANSLRTQANTAPDQTRADIDHLRAIEKAGKTRMQLGGALLVVGGIGAAAGIVRAVIQRSSATERPVIDVVPEAGGASVLFTKEWR